jgi:hypothetical protein
MLTNRKTRHTSSSVSRSMSSTMTKTGVVNVENSFWLQLPEGSTNLGEPKLKDQIRRLGQPCTLKSARNKYALPLHTSIHCRGPLGAQIQAGSSTRILGHRIPSSHVPETDLRAARLVWLRWASSVL